MARECGAGSLQGSGRADAGTVVGRDRVRKGVCTRAMPSHVDFSKFIFAL